MHRRVRTGGVVALGICAVVMGYILWQQSPEATPQPIADPINPDYTQATAPSNPPSLTERIIDRVIADKKSDETKVAEAAQTSKQASSIVSFKNTKAKQAFLVSNQLSAEDLQQIASRLSYVVAKPVEELNATDGAIAQPNVVYQATLTPNDPLHSSNYYTEVIGLDTAWDTTTGTNTIVAVIDTGFGLNHEDMENRWYINAAESGSGKETNGLDDDSNGLIDDWRGWDFANSAQGDNSPQAGSTNPGHFFVSHGTNTSGLVGATGNNAKGVASASWQARILPLQALGDNGSGFTSDIVAAIDYAVEQGAQIISLSLGSTQSDPAMETAINDAVAAGVTVIAAAGNCGSSSYASQGCDYQGQMLYPGRYNNAISVGATTANDERADFSSWGPELDITAPGSGAIRTPTWSAGNQTTSYTNSADGTSIATPIVAGVAALLLAEEPSATPAQIRQKLTNYSSRVAAMGCQKNGERYGYGRVNAANSLNSTLSNPLVQSCKQSIRNTDFNGDGLGDIFWHRPGAGTDYIWTGNNAASRFDATSLNIDGSYQQIPGDYNNDGRSDIFWYRPGIAKDYVWYGTATPGAFINQPMNVGGNHRPISGDFNGDGRSDVFWYSPGSGADYLWTSQQQLGNFSSKRLYVNSDYVVPQ